MRTTDATVLSTLHQARAFIDSHIDQLGPLESAGYRRKLEEVISELEQFSVEQDTAHRTSKGQVARQRALCAALRLNHMRPIAAIAAARLREIPEFNAFRMPLHRAKTTELVIAADAMARMARAYASVFIEGGLAKDFVERLEAAARALADCVTERQTSLTLKAGASAGLRTEASRGRHVLRVLSALIEPKLEHDDALLAGWRTARHIRRPAKAQPVIFPLMGLAVTPSVPVQLALPPGPSEQISRSQMQAEAVELDRASVQPAPSL